MINNENDPFKTISNNSANIMNYLVRKLESREKKIKRTRQLIYSINAFEDLYSNKKDIINTLAELEEDLKQASCAIKALLTENRALTLGIESKEENIKNLMNDNNYLTAENENLKSQILIYNNNISNNNNTDVKELYNISGNNIIESNKIDKKILTKVTEETDDSIFNVNQLSNVKNIMKNMKSNKQKLKDAIEKHFTTNNNSEINTYNTNNSLQISDNENKIENPMAFNYNYEYNSKNSDLLMRIMNNPDNINLLNYTIGKDFMEKIIDPNCPKEYLNEIENIISGNCNDNKFKTIPKKNKQIKSHSVYKNMYRQSSDINSKPNQNKRNKDLNNSFTSNRCQILNKMKEGVTFEKSLRDYPIQNTASQKRFNNFTNPYGGYFD